MLAQKILDTPTLEHSLNTMLLQPTLETEQDVVNVVPAHN